MQKDYINWGKILTKWEQTVYNLSNKFGLKIEQGPNIKASYLGYFVIGTGYNNVVVYNIKNSMFEETQDLKFAEECVKAYIPIIKKWKVHFRELALESDFK
jgi:hypothetical protein